MSINHGPSLDMASSDVLEDYQEMPSATKVIEDRDAQQFTNLQTNRSVLFAPSEKSIREIKEYFKDPDDNLKELIDEKYNGEIDGNVDEELINIASLVEDEIFNVLGEEKVFGMVLKSSINEINSAVNNVIKYKNMVEKEEIANKYSKLDDRFAFFSKLL